MRGPRNRDLDWRSGHPKLCAWFDSFATAPPAA